MVALEVKAAFVWILGGILMLAGSFLVANTGTVTAAIQVPDFLVFLASLVLFLFSGLCWIAVAVEIKK